MLLPYTNPSPNLCHPSSPAHPTHSLLPSPHTRQYSPHSIPHLLLVILPACPFRPPPSYFSPPLFQKRTEVQYRCRRGVWGMHVYNIAPSYCCFFYTQIGRRYVIRPMHKHSNGVDTTCNALRTRRNSQYSYTWDNKLCCKGKGALMAQTMQRLP